MRSNKPAIIVHGGAGNWPANLHPSAVEGVRRAADAGFETLRGGGSALDAVEHAVVLLEDNPVFNAGTGSTLNLLGDVETDAAIMDGTNLRGGAVAMLRTIRNPIKAARIVMEQTDHVLMAGTPAEKLALENGLPTANLKVPGRVKSWRDGLAHLKTKPPRAFSKTTRLFMRNRSDTVGALAIDLKVYLAAGDSTGGVSLKLPGRIGDSPILGAGLYADDTAGAATATGMGEQAIRLVISKMACDLMRRKSATAAATSAVRYSTRKLGPGMGLLTLDRKGRFGVVHNTRNLCWAATTQSARLQGMKGIRVK